MYDADRVQVRRAKRGVGRHAWGWRTASLHRSRPGDGPRLALARSVLRAVTSTTCVAVSPHATGMALVEVRTHDSPNAVRVLGEREPVTRHRLASSARTPEGPWLSRKREPPHGRLRTTVMIDFRGDGNCTRSRANTRASGAFGDLRRSCASQPFSLSSLSCSPLPCSSCLSCRPSSMDSPFSPGPNPPSRDHDRGSRGPAIAQTLRPPVVVGLLSSWRYPQ